MRMIPPMLLLTEIITGEISHSPSQQNCHRGYTAGYNQCGTAKGTYQNADRFPVFYRVGRELNM